MTQTLLTYIIYISIYPCHILVIYIYHMHPIHYYHIHKYHTIIYTVYNNIYVIPIHPIRTLGEGVVRGRHGPHGRGQQGGVQQHRQEQPRPALRGKAILYMYMKYVYEVVCIHRQLVYILVYAPLSSCTYTV